MEHLSSSECVVQDAHAGVMFFKLISRAAHNELLSLAVAALIKILYPMLDLVAQGPWPDVKVRPEFVPVRWKMLDRLRERDAVAPQPRSIYVQQVKYGHSTAQSCRLKSERT
jgi:DNA-binding FadR family transcriptional regulator